jgi:uncharacterized LabA/DUF88 family protein
VVARVILFVDYQNVALLAHRTFRTQSTGRIANIDPIRLGKLVASRRHEESELVGVRVYRGLPSPGRDPQAFAANDRQADAWDRTRAVTTVRRPLRYPRDWPENPPQEKGIDVALAVDFVRLAMERRYDAGILFSSDTDLLPALETVVDLNLARAEVATWASTFRLRLSGKNQLWCHHLSRSDYLAVLDPTDYRRPTPRQMY